MCYRRTFIRMRYYSLFHIDLGAMTIYRGDIYAALKAGK